jgi:hypothetical protein
VTLNNSTAKAINRTPIDSIKQAMLKQAFNLLGRKYQEVVYQDNKKFTLDCYGLVSIIYHAAGIDITKSLSKFGGSGVGSLYKFLKAIGALHKDKIPSTGDIIFWDNTWDSNNDKIIGNDPLTHTGMVLKVDDDGTIHYIHANYSLGICVERMNLYRPTEYKDEKGRIINNPMYLSSSLYNHPEHWLAGDLCRQFGNLLDNKEKIN